MSSPQTFQALILALQEYWANQGCVLQQPYDIEVSRSHAVKTRKFYTLYSLSDKYFGRSPSFSLGLPN